MKKVCFVVGSLDISGGLNVVLQHAAHMQRCGLGVTIATQRQSGTMSADWHAASRDVPKLPIAEVRDHFDLVIGTWWETVYDLPRLAANRYAYFVQGADFLLAPPAQRPRAEATYSFGLGAMTVSRALGDALADRCWAPLLVAPNGVDKQVFNPIGPAIAKKRPGKLRVLVEGPLGAKTKGVAYAIRMAQQAKADEIWLLTSSPIAWYPGVSRVFSGLDAAGCAAVYRSCDVLLKLSSLESCSLPILEMLHCGGAVITYDIASPNEYLTHGRNALLVPIRSADAVLAALAQFRDDPALRQRLANGARQWAAGWPDWHASSEQFLLHCRALCDRPGPSREALQAAIDLQKRMLSPSCRSPSIGGRVKSGLALIDGLGRRSRTYRGVRIVVRARLLEQGAPPIAEVSLRLPKLLAAE